MAFGVVVLLMQARVIDSDSALDSIVSELDAKCKLLGHTKKQCRKMKKGAVSSSLRERAPELPLCLNASDPAALPIECTSRTYDVAEVSSCCAGTMLLLPMKFTSLLHKHHAQPGHNPFSCACRVHQNTYTTRVPKYCVKHTHVTHIQLPCCIIHGVVSSVHISRKRSVHHQRVVVKTAVAGCPASPVPTTIHKHACARAHTQTHTRPPWLQ